MILAIDTAASLCAACVWDQAAGRELGRAVEDIGKGHAERLMGVIERALAGADAGWHDLTSIAVVVGPGSFTGIRVGVSAARGLALALAIPSVGVTTLSAIAAEAAVQFPDRRIVAAIDAKRDELYVEDHAPDGTLAAGPAMIAVADAGAFAAGTWPVLTGSGADVMAEAVRAADPDARFDLAPSGVTADIATYARLAAAGRIAGAPPKPLYLRAPDARPQDGFALPRREP